MTISSWTLNKGEKKKKTEETKHADAGWESSDVSFFSFFLIALPNHCLYLLAC